MGAASLSYNTGSQYKLWELRVMNEYNFLLTGSVVYIVFCYLRLKMTLTTLWESERKNINNIVNFHDYEIVLMLEKNKLKWFNWGQAVHEDDVQKEWKW